MYSSDVVIWLHKVLICVKPHKLTNYTFEKKNFFWKFFWCFLSIFYVVLAQIQKNQYVLKTSKSCLFETIDIYLIGLFFLILLQFLKKKHDQKKNFFFKKIFFDFWKSPFLSIIRRDLTKKKFENFKKKFFKKNYFFKMSNESTCVIRHKLKLYVTKWPHLRNTRIAFLWSKCLYYCHTSQSKYKS